MTGFFFCRKKLLYLGFLYIKGFLPIPYLSWSERQDLNLRPLDPQSPMRGETFIMTQQDIVYTGEIKKTPGLDNTNRGGMTIL
jgi:hypothetical protein